MGGTGRLAGDLVHGSVCTHELGQKRAARARGHHGIDADFFSKALAQRGQARAHGVTGIACGAQVLRVQQAAPAVEKNEVRRGRANIDAKGGVHAAVCGGFPLVTGKADVALASDVAAVWQRRQARERGRSGDPVATCGPQ